MLRIGLAQFVVFLVATVNIRLVAAGDYLGTALSDVAILWIGFSVTQGVAQSKTTLDRVAYTVGGVAGSLVGLWFTK